MPAEKELEESTSDKKSKSSGNAASQKSKDLSHVPCKFFKVGSCTAGASCPFSHNVEPGAPKDVCAWFIKGNCKFGHKCALAHILPGQPMSMDRKNKKAAQMANNANNPPSSSSTPTSGKDRERSKSGKKEGRGDGTRAANAANSLLSGGSTAPTRPIARGPPALSKASLTSPSAPAPPITVKGTEFVDELAQQEDPKRGSKRGDDPSSPPLDAIPPDGTPKPPATHPKPVGLHPQPTSSGAQDLPAPPVQANAHSPTSPSRINGFSPGTSPSHNPLGNGVLSSSPFAVPTKSMFISSTYAGEVGLLSSRAGGPSSSLGAGRWGETEPSPNAQQAYKSVNAEYDSTYPFSGKRVIVDDRSQGDDDTGGEDFVPSSLTDLLTPEEMKRRMTRGAPQTRSPNMGPRLSEGEDSLRIGANLSAAHPSGHRHSRSVPSPSLLGDVRNIWADPSISASPSGLNASGLPASPGRLANGYTPIPTHSARDSSTLNSAGSAASFGNHLSPSNASAAFLSSALHQQYAKSRPGNVGRNVFGATHHRPSGLDFGNHSAAAFSTSPSSQNLGQGIQTSSADFFPVHRANAPSNASYTNRYPNDLTSMGIGESGILSPGTRALQSHAPGQSLPQGLAAGYSRIHALPPPLPLNSPTSSRGLPSGGFLPGTSPLSSSLSAQGGGGAGDWGASQDGDTGTTPTKGAASMEQMFSKPSYSQAARAPAVGAQNTTSTGSLPFLPPQVSRSTSGRGPGGVGSPLASQSGASGDDELFTMDN